MRKVIYYVTQSLDGYIADQNGSVDWLYGAPNTDYGYEDFYASVDTVLFGSATYETILSFGDYYPYEDKQVFVYSSKPLVSVSENTTICSEPAAHHVARLKLEEGSDIWLGGGGKLGAALLNAGLVDELRIFVQPILLGQGIRLVEQLDRFIGLDLVNHKVWPGNLVELHYTLIKGWRSDV